MRSAISVLPYKGTDQTRLKHRVHDLAAPGMRYPSGAGNMGRQRLRSDHLSHAPTSSFDGVFTNLCQFLMPKGNDMQNDESYHSPLSNIFTAF